MVSSCLQCARVRGSYPAPCHSAAKGCPTLFALYIMCIHFSTTAQQPSAQPGICLDMCSARLGRPATAMRSIAGPVSSHVLSQNLCCAPAIAVIANPALRQQVLLPSRQEQTLGSLAQHRALRLAARVNVEGMRATCHPGWPCTLMLAAQQQQQLGH
jgi:hypothetical protein